jgi:hypothetical protein
MNNTQGISAEDIERMRALVAQHDSKQGAIVKEFDLNNPPKVQYRHQEFPKMLYQHESGKTKAVHNAKEEDKSLKAGWRKDPPVPVQEPQAQDEE